MDFSVGSLRSRFLVPVSDDMMGSGAASAAKKIARMAVRYPAGRLPEVQPAAGQSMKVFQAIREAQAARVDITA
jgi:hypothetical protein